MVYSVYTFNNVSTNWQGIDTVNFNGIGKTDSILGNQFYGDPNGAFSGSSFNIYTPAALNMQIDVPLTTTIFCNLSLLQRIPMGKNLIRRSNAIAFVPRYETRFFEFALPVTFYDYKKARIGASMRYGAFTLGTDVLGALVGITDTYGADLYFGITIKNFGGCDRNKSSRSKLEQCNTPK